MREGGTEREWLNVEEGREVRGEQEEIKEKTRLKNIRYTEHAKLNPIFLTRINIH